MEKRMIALLTVCIVLLAACAGLAASDPASEIEVQAAVEYEEPVYVFEQTEAGEEYPADSGSVAARYSCRLLMLSVSNPDALSPEDGEAAARCAENFNSKMHSLMIDAVGAGQTMRELAEEVDSAAEAYYDETEAGYVQIGQIVSVRVDNGSYTGGAHPNRYAVSYLFDLEAGQFIDPLQLADDPEALRTGAAALLLEKAEEHPVFDSFWQDYPELIARWNEGTVLFAEEGMKVVYSPYEIAPYGMGDVELTLTWEELEPLIGESGMERLGMMAHAE